MAIICDNCNCDVTPDMDTDMREDHIIDLNGGKKCLCTDCFRVLSDWACSKKHKEASKEFNKELV